MKKAILSFLIVLGVLSSRAHAEYELPQVQDRIVLLLDVRSVSLSDNTLTFPLGATNRQMGIDLFQMQDRIWSDGICVGVETNDARSSAVRVATVQEAIGKKQEGLLLVECVQVGAWRISYLRLFDPVIEFPRYFPKKEFYDTIQLPDTIQPTSTEEFQRDLTALSETSMTKLLAGNPTVDTAPLSSGEAVWIRPFGHADVENLNLILDVDGNINLPLLGGVHVAGLTPAETEKLIETLYVENGYYREIDLVVSRLNE